jgi:hypothetical protein
MMKTSLQASLCVGLSALQFAQARYAMYVDEVCCSSNGSDLLLTRIVPSHHSTKQHCNCWYRHCDYGIRQFLSLYYRTSRKLYSLRVT